MRLSLRFVLPLMLVLAAIAYGVAPLVDQLTLRWFVRDMDIRAKLIANAMHDPLVEQLKAGSKTRVANYFARVAQDERLYAIGYCATPESPPLATRSLPAEIRCDNLDQWEEAESPLLTSPRGPLHVAVKPLEGGEEDGEDADAGTEPAAEPKPRAGGWLVLIHDMSFVERRSAETKRYVFYFFMGLAAVISLITVVIAQLSWRGWVSGMRSLLRGEGLLRDPGQGGNAPEFRPIARDLQRLIRELETEHLSRDESQITWTPDSLRAILHGELRGEDVIVVSNREPYIHQRRGERVEIQRPASGLVTALTPEEEAGYYYGFANEGLWPLCHIAHVRPTFRSADWAHYVAVNKKFAKAVKAEARTHNPIVMIQDYHFALLPRMIHEELPEATIITFWHIPWPNPESFAICPWREEIISGLLGSSILGFHTQFHCNNFVDTVDRTIEARVDRESFTVSLGGKLTAVRRYPISIAWPPEPEMVAKPVDQCRAEIRRTEGLPAEQMIGVGVDRLDYTKGITERFRAVERLLESKPEWIGRFSFVQIAAPSRSGIDEYQHHEAQVRALATRINERFGVGRRDSPPPIILKVEHHEPHEVYAYYRAAELCFVSSLHDGMNLVTKEFVAARDDERGVLILSQFTGAARELPEAVIVNPYDADQCAAALHVALTMPAAEQRDRMRLMRGLVREFNVYRWAGRMLLDAATMRRRDRLTEKPVASASPL